MDTATPHLYWRMRALQATSPFNFATVGFVIGFKANNSFSWNPIMFLHYSNSKVESYFSYFGNLNSPTVCLPFTHRHSLRGWSGCFIRGGKRGYVFRILASFRAGWFRTRVQCLLYSGRLCMALCLLGITSWILQSLNFGIICFKSYNTWVCQILNINRKKTKPFYMLLYELMFEDREYYVHKLHRI